LLTTPTRPVPLSFQCSILKSEWTTSFAVSTFVPRLTLYRFDWQLRIDAHDILDPKYMPKEYAEFESGVGVIPAPEPAGITGPPMQRASWPRGYGGLVRVTNKPVIQFRLGKTDHILEIAREDVYEIDSILSPTPMPESKWTASFYYSKWVNDLGEFGYLRHGEKTSWQPSLSTFFPEEGDTTNQSAQKPKGPRNFLKEIEVVKNILWDATRALDDDQTEDLVTISQRIGIVEDQDGENGSPVK
jgi:hypothetical protein